jgi:hypothetical protein
VDQGAVMHQQFTYQEATRLDAHRAAHASDPRAHSAFRRHRRLFYRWWESAHARVRTSDVIIDLREHPRAAAPFVGQPEFLDTPEDHLDQRTDGDRAAPAAGVDAGLAALEAGLLDGAFDDGAWMDLFDRPPEAGHKRGPALSHRP